MEKIFSPSAEQPTKKEPNKEKIITRRDALKKIFKFGAVGTLAVAGMWPGESKATTARNNVEEKVNAMGNAAIEGWLEDQKKRREKSTETTPPAVKEKESASLIKDTWNEILSTPPMEMSAKLEKLARVNGFESSREFTEAMLRPQNLKQGIEVYANSLGFNSVDTANFDEDQKNKLLESFWKYMDKIGIKYID